MLVKHIFFAALRLAICVQGSPFLLDTDAPAVLRRSTSATYAIVSGDTGNAIAAKYSIAFATLSSSNPGVNWNSLTVGQTIQMPGLRKHICYTVVSGDTGTKIAAKENVQFADLQLANPSVDWSNLQIGQRLQVPGYGTKTTFTVGSGDTGNAIAAAFGIAFSCLSSANPGADWARLQVGQILQVPAGLPPS